MSARAEPWFEIFEHTADVGIIARGPTLAETFGQAARGMYALMVNLDAVEPREQRDVTATGGDGERLLVNWLVDLLFLTETEGLVFSWFAVDIMPGATELHARVRGEPLDVERHEAAFDVKAVTYHDLEIVEDPDGWTARVIFDV